MCMPFSLLHRTTDHRTVADHAQKHEKGDIFDSIWDAWYQIDTACMPHTSTVIDANYIIII